MFQELFCRAVSAAHKRSSWLGRAIQGMKKLGMIGKAKFIGITTAAIIAVEISVRASGIVDFPTYSVDAEIGYLPKESQSGVFLNGNDWYFNEKSMPIAQNWNPNLRPNILLIGNSIVMGGNPYRQQDKLTPQIQKRLGTRPIVWPIAAGGWTQINQITYLDRHPEIVAEADYLEWEYMNGGLSHANPWPGQYVFPSHRPIYATWYALRRYLLPRIFSSLGASELPTIGPVDRINVERFDRAIGALARSGNGTHEGIIWLYPVAAQVDEARRGREWLPERRQIEEIANKHGLRIVDIAAKPEWNTSLYRDDGVHPNVEGNGVLASILVEEFSRDKMK
jgi:hypothetical protein